MRLLLRLSCAAIAFGVIGIATANAQPYGDRRDHRPPPHRYYHHRYHHPVVIIRHDDHR